MITGKRKGSSDESPSRKAELARKGKPVGRPRHEFDYEKIKSLAALGMTNRSMASSIGIHETSFSYYCEKDPKFLKAYKSGRAMGEQALLSSLMQMVRDKNLGAIIFSLKAIYGFREKVTVEHTGDAENPIRHSHAHMTESEIASRIQELLNREENQAVAIPTTASVDSDNGVGE